MKEKKLITICTPTFNRGYILKRPFESLLNQTNKNFIWIIIDDGSTDNTKSIVKEFIKKADFEIKYYKKENGGRHTALNYSYEKIETEFVINLDSDDCYVPDAIEKIYKIIYSIPKKDYNKYWQISGRCIDSKTHELVGKKFFSNINSFSGKKQRKKIAKCYGEKSNCRKLSILKQYKFPVFEDTKFVPENMIWEKINLVYDTYCTNEIFRIYYQDSNDSLSTGGIHNSTRNASYYHYSVFCINELFDQFFYNSHVRYSLINVARKGMLCGKKYKDIMKDIKSLYKKIIITIFGYPLAYFTMIIKHEK